MLPVIFGALGLVGVASLGEATPPQPTHPRPSPIPPASTGEPDPEEELSQLEGLVRQLDIEIDQFEDEIEATVPNVSPSFGFVWTVLGIAGIVSLSKRIEGKLRSVQRRVNHLTRRLERAHRQERSRKSQRLMQRVDTISTQLESMEERFSELKDIIDAEGVTP